jgi:integrase
MATLKAVQVPGLTKTGRYADGRGLFLDVRGGARAWVYRYQLNNRDRLMSLGSPDDGMSLAEARIEHAKVWAMVKDKRDPLDVRQQETQQKIEEARAIEQAKLAAQSFAEVSELYVASHRAGWRGRRSLGAWQQTLRDYINPVIGDMAVADIQLGDVLKVLQPIWQTVPESASRIRGRIEVVLDYAAAKGWRTGPNPAIWRGGLKALLPAKPKVRPIVPHPAIDWHEAPAFMAKLAALDTMQAMALRLVILTAARSGEVRGMTWSEVNFDTATWTVPAKRMKAGKDHRVPLSVPALELLRRLWEMRSGDLVFPNRSGRKPLLDCVLVRVIRLLGDDHAVVHGFRSTFRDWCSDTGKSADAAEAALAHLPASKVVAAYARSDLLEPRRQLMAQWASYLTQPSAEVIRLVA